MRHLFLVALAIVFSPACVASDPSAGEDEVLARMVREFPPVAGRWSVERANAWHDELPWLVGCNYYPATAINAIDMWQAASFDPATIDRELGWAESLGFNTLRVYLHDLVWADDERGLYERMDQFLDLCDSHGIRPFFVFFDDCHFPDPRLGEQPRPVPRYHNSGWVNSPARELAFRYHRGEETTAERDRLRGYVQRTIERFGDDERVLFWELYNEPGRGAGALEGDAPSGNQPTDMMGDRSNRLVHDSWRWARDAAPSQPITSCTAGSVGAMNIAINRANSDLHSIHNYGDAASVERMVRDYQSDGRPVVMTEWLARTRGNTVADVLPVLKRLGVGAVHWGFVSGETGTVWPWYSRDGRDAPTERRAGNVLEPGDPYPEPDVWFHDLLRTDGSAYDPDEVATFRRLTGVESESDASAGSR